MDGDEDAIDYNDDDPEDEEVYEADLSSFIWWRKSRRERSKSAYDAEINEIVPDDLGESWIKRKKTTKDSETEEE